MKCNYWLLLLVFSVACGSGNASKNTEKDSPTEGTIHILSDNAYQPIVDSEIKTFTTQYAYAQVTPKFLNEVDAWQEFIADSGVLIVSSRKPTQNETDYLRSKKIIPKITHLAYDGVALLLHPSVSDTCITYDEIRQIINGEITDWSQVASGKKKGPIQLVLDHERGSSARYMRENFLQTKTFPKTITAAQNYQGVIQWVNEHPNALGVIGVSWVCDPDDPQMVSFLSKVKVAEVAATEEARRRGEGYQPFQAYLAQKKYLLTREIYAISRQPYAGLALGFASYMAGPKGQLIFLKSGLLPATQPIRIQSIK